jgi:hypothetical protein
MTEIQPQTPAPHGFEPSLSPPLVEDPPISDPPPDPRRTHAAMNSEEAGDRLSEAEQLPRERDLGGPEDTLAGPGPGPGPGPGDGTDGPDAPDEPGPRPPGFPEPPGSDEDAPDEPS